MRFSKLAALTILCVFAPAAACEAQEPAPAPPPGYWATVEIVDFGTNPATGYPAVEVYNEVSSPGASQTVFTEIWAMDSNGRWGYGSSSHGSIPGAMTTSVASVSPTHADTDPLFNPNDVIYIEAYAETRDAEGLLYDDDYDYWFD